MKGMIWRRTACVALAAALLLSGCGKDNDPAVPAPEEELPIVIEEGVNSPAQDPTLEPGIGQSDLPEPEPSVPADKGEDSTIEDIIAAQASIKSFYFEQTLQYPGGHIFVQVWFKDDKMKVVSSQNGVAVNEDYYNYEAGSVVSFSPGVSDSAIQMDFDQNSENAPDNPVKDDYSTFTLNGGEYIDGQYCLILQATNGDLLWVDTKYGFPRQAQYIDSLGEQMTSAYRNVEFNTVEDGEVAPPDDLEIYYFGS